jgi:DNA replication regulator SLD3
LPLKKLDQKYKDALPNSVKLFTSGVLDGQDGELPPPKKRKSKKKRMGKDGMYPDEIEFVAQWWKGRSISNPTESIGASHESECKRLLAGLRLRETQLQILIILEIMGLEQSIRPTGASELEGRDASTEATASTTKPRRKNPEDLRSLLDLLLDRLCIWQSLSTDQEVSPEKPGSLKTERKVGKEGDVLRDFCVEVIVPFYASRLPDCCKAISRKLGGLSNTSPTRPPLAKAASTSQVLPGTTMRRERRDQARRPLQRVLTDEKAAPHLRPPSLTRSNTAPPNRLIKREESESSQPLQPGTRGGIQKAKRIDNREVDLDAIAKQHEAKLRKMNALKEQKKELDDAINALRKPNRTLVSKDFMDTAVQRTVTNSRKSRNPVRNPAGIGVQVTATPKINRKRDVHVGSRSRRAQTVRTQTHSPDAQPPEFPSSETNIPSSVVRPGPSQVGMNSHTAAANAQSRMHERSLYTIQETPSRGPSRQSDPLGLKQKAQSGEADELPPPLPPLSRLPKASNSSFKVPDHPLQTPRASRHRLLSDTSTPHHRQVNQNESTPSQQSRKMRQTSLRTLIKPEITATPDDGEDELAFIPVSSPPMPSRPHSEMTDPVGEKSIFEALGWDNYDDDLDELA